MTLQVGDLIPIGGSGNVKKSEVLEGKTYSSDEGVELVGEMPNNGVLSKTITTQNGKQIITPGYYEGGEIKAQFSNLTSGNIRKGVNIGGVVGSLPDVSQIKTKSGGWTYGQDKTEIITVDGEVVALTAIALMIDNDKNYVLKTAQGKDYARAETPESGWGKSDISLQKTASNEVEINFYADNSALGYKHEVRYMISYI